MAISQVSVVIQVKEKLVTPAIMMGDPVLTHKNHLAARFLPIRYVILFCLRTVVYRLGWAYLCCFQD
jgi:hypothetical protein